MSDDTWKPFIESINKRHAQYEEEKKKQVEDIIDFIYKIIKETPMTTSEEGYKGAGVDYRWFTDEELPPPSIQYPKVEPEPDNNLPRDHQAHMEFHKSVIDNYEAYKLIEVLTEILDEVRKINNKSCKPKKKKKVKK